MPWIRLDDQFPDHPKVMEAGPLAAWLYVCGIGYCNRLLTDGFIPVGQLRKLADLDNAGDLAARLVAVGLWEEADGGYTVHDYLEYQPSRDKALELREKRADAGSRGGKQKASKLLGVCQDVASDMLVAKAKQNSTPYPSRTHPVPVPTPDPIPTPAGEAVRPAPKRVDTRPTLTGYQPSQQMVDWVATNCPNVVLPDVLENWRDWHTAKGTVIKDYDASLRTWLRRESTHPTPLHRYAGKGRPDPNERVTLANGDTFSASTAAILQQSARLKLGGE